MKIGNILNGLGFLLIILFFMTAGFYFGYRVKENQSTGSELVSASGVSETTTSKSSVQILPTEGVSWIKSGQSPICPTTHPIKGTFQTDGGNFYTTDNKTYDRVKPDICFATLEFAKDSAGFVQKF